MRLTIKRIEMNTLSYRKHIIGKKKQDSGNEKDELLYYQMQSERSCFENIIIIP